MPSRLQDIMKELLDHCEKYAKDVRFRYGRLEWLIGDQWRSSESLLSDVAVNGTLPTLDDPQTKGASVPRVIDKLRTLCDELEECNWFLSMGHIAVTNPAEEFTALARVGEFDRLSDDEYEERRARAEEQSAIFSKSNNRFDEIAEAYLLLHRD